MGTKCSIATAFALLSIVCGPVYADSSWVDDDDDYYQPQQFQQQQPQQQAQRTAPARNNQQPNVRELSEAFGHFIGQDISKHGIHLDLDAVIEGLRNGVAGHPAPMNENEYEEVVANFRNKHFQEVANFNLALADAFMASNAKRQDIVQATPGKVQYSVLQRGKGNQVQENTAPQLKFSGRFIDGTLFTTTEGDRAINVPLDEMIPGFREGVIGMREGEKRRIFVHPDSGYGVAGDIAPNSLLLFEVEVIKTGDRVTPQPGNRNRQTAQNEKIQKAAFQQDDWDLALDEEDTDDEEDDGDEEFSSERLILEPAPKNVAFQSEAERQNGYGGYGGNNQSEHNTRQQERNVNQEMRTNNRQQQTNERQWERNTRQQQRNEGRQGRR
ncbi:MAG: FKBP-type peptidyl-prolyl cis-trans isomerase [Chlamydiales bacterium]|nr:FKBP-type peptidyl-prolyl cis-trans isomerase [Chlamydiales bacterium]